ncbi:MAG: hypothetical protein EOO54_17385 [Haliea sp.]|nr:MAG: hypothetical protein EOO54_17385 [Haliea sp.]
MDAEPRQIIRLLTDRITVIALRTYEVEQLLVACGGHHFRRVACDVDKADYTPSGTIEFACRLTLQAQGPAGERLPSAYQVAVTGYAGFESPIWHINDIIDVVADPVDRGDHSDFAAL